MAVVFQKSQRKNKFNAKRVQHDGRWFDSVAERNRYIVLKDMERLGEISHLECQPRFNLTASGRPVRYRPSDRQAFYKADFSYFSKARNARIVEDVKGVMTREFLLKRAIVEAEFAGILIEVVK